jgi:hypothetical protein
MAMIEDAYVRNYRPTFVIDQRGVMKYADPPLLAGLPGQDSVPSIAMNSATQPALISPVNSSN